jgi:hypothetical protein
VSITESYNWRVVLPYLAKIVLHCPNGLHEGLEPLVHAFIRDGVTFVAVAGSDASLIEDIIDEVCVGDGTRPYEMLTSSHPGESLAAVVEFARSLSLEYAGTVEVVEF